MAASHSAIVREDKLADKSYEGRDIKLLKVRRYLLYSWFIKNIQLYCQEQNNIWTYNNVQF